MMAIRRKKKKKKGKAKENKGDEKWTNKLNLIIDLTIVQGCYINGRLHLQCFFHSHTAQCQFLRCYFICIISLFVQTAYTN